MKAIFTTSWDDGNPADLRMVRLLDEYGLKGTFYIMCSKIKASDLNEQYLQTISQNHEVGSHLIDHVDLTTLIPSEAFHQLSKSKEGLEKAIPGLKVQMLSYPWGKYNEGIKELAKKAGYIGARTSQTKPPIFPRDPYEMPVTLGVWGDWRRVKLQGVWALGAVCRNGGVFHLAGHCWELKEKKWEKLEQFFNTVSKIPNLTFLTNGEVIKWIEKNSLKCGTP